jgi:hypothetical protein
VASELLGVSRSVKERAAEIGRPLVALRIGVALVIALVVLLQSGVEPDAPVSP